MSCKFLQKLQTSIVNTARAKKSGMGCNFSERCSWGWGQSYTQRIAKLHHHCDLVCFIANIFLFFLLLATNIFCLLGCQQHSGTQYILSHYPILDPKLNSLLIHYSIPVFLKSWIQCHYWVQLFFRKLLLSQYTLLEIANMYVLNT